MVVLKREFATPDEEMKKIVLKARARMLDSLAAPLFHLCIAASLFVGICDCAYNYS